MGVFHVKRHSGHPALWVAAFILTALMAAMGYGVRQSDFFLLISWYIPFFLIYWFLFSWISGETEIRFLTYLGLFLRFLLIFSFPNLSDDVYRFIWDGRLTVNGYNPFNHVPSDYLMRYPGIPGIDRALYRELNSPEYYTVYPPVAQAVFAVACGLFRESLTGSVIVMKLFLFAFEAGSLHFLRRLLDHFQLPAKNIVLYALNPLIILEIMGNLHFEGAMIFFLLLAYWSLIRGRYQLSAMAMALSIASKLLPLLFLPFLLLRLGWRKSIWYFGLMALFLLLLFSPLLNAVFVQHLGESLGLYFHQFEFNAGIYYLLRWLGYQLLGYNLINVVGPVLGGSAFFGILTVAFLEKDQSWKGWAGKLLFAITWYLALATTVHPWYVSLPLVACLFTRFRYPVIWSGLIFLTYINYSYPVFRENLWVVALEYVVVLSALIAERFFLVYRLSHPHPTHP